MGAMTIRGLDDVTMKALRDKAKQEGSSINAALLKILRKELGIEKGRVYTFHKNSSCCIENLARL